jgi:8-oxo-dGTP pyrophosphatase MutT (NUDIX family)
MSAGRLFADEATWPAWRTASCEVQALTGDEALLARRSQVLDALTEPQSLDAGSPTAHLTVSAYVVDTGGRVLLIRHPVFGVWQPPGGHVEPSDGSLIAAAVREAREETGVDELLPCRVVDVETYRRSCPRNGASHHDVRFLLRTPRQTYRDVISGESDGCLTAWFPVKGLIGLVSNDVLRTVALSLAELDRLR